jgi:hypothetical protein
MSPAAAHPGPPAQSAELLSEAAWPWPIDVTRYDRARTLTSPEAAALALLAEQTRKWHPPHAARGLADPPPTRPAASKRCGPA